MALHTSPNTEEQHGNLAKSCDLPGNSRATTRPFRRCAPIFVCMHADTPTHTYKSTYVCMYVHTYVRMYARVFLHASRCVYEYLYIYICIHTYIHTYIYIYPCIHTHVLMHAWRYAVARIHAETSQVRIRHDRRVAQSSCMQRWQRLPKSVQSPNLEAPKKLQKCHKNRCKPNSRKHVNLQGYRIKNIKHVHRPPRNLRSLESRSRHAEQVEKRSNVWPGMPVGGPESNLALGSPGTRYIQHEMWKTNKNLVAPESTFGTSDVE